MLAEAVGEGLFAGCTFLWIACYIGMRARGPGRIEVSEEAVVAFPDRDTVEGLVVVSVLVACERNGEHCTVGLGVLDYVGVSRYGFAAK